MKFQEILRKAANRIEKYPEEYDWLNPTMCNCGIVAQVASGLNNEQLWSKIHEEEWKGWSGSSGFSYAPGSIGPFTCPISQLSSDNIFYILRKAGFNGKDIVNLETLFDRKIRAKAGLYVCECPQLNYLHYSDYDNPISTVKYMRAMANMRDKQEKCKNQKSADVIYKKPLRQNHSLVLETI